MNLATPAPQVEPAIAEKASVTEPATAESAPEEDAAVALPPTAGGSARILEFLDNTSDGTNQQQQQLTVDILRGETGCDLESEAAILAGGAPPKNILKRLLPFVFDERDYVTYSQVKKYCVVKEDTCFVYAAVSDPCPLYAFSLVDLQAVVENRHALYTYSVTISPLPDTNLPPEHMVTVLLFPKDDKKKKRSSSNVQHQFTFNTLENPNLAQQFVDCVQAVNDKSKANNSSVTKEEATEEKATEK